MNCALQASCIERSVAKPYWPGYDVGALGSDCPRRDPV
jgi:hypothetical protein